MNKRHLLSVGDWVSVREEAGVLTRIDGDVYTVELDSGGVKRCTQGLLYEPTPEEIAAACRRIRDSLSPGELESRAIDPTLRHHPAEIPMADVMLLTWENQESVKGSE